MMNKYMRNFTCGVLSVLFGCTSTSTYLSKDEELKESIEHLWNTMGMKCHSSRYDNYLPGLDKNEYPDGVEAIHGVRVPEDSTLKYFIRPITPEEIEAFEKYYDPVKDSLDL